MSGSARTVLGDVAAADLGITYCHEHLFTDPGHSRGQRGSADLVLDDRDAGTEELRLFKEAGGGAIVELTTEEYGRDPSAMVEASRRSGVHVIAATGHIMEPYWAGVVAISDRTDDELFNEMVGDLTEGFAADPSVRAGVIKVGTSQDQPHPDEVRVLRAAARAQLATGASISTHTSSGTLPLTQIRILEENGANLERVVIGHMDHSDDTADHLAIVQSGCTIGFDQLSKEHYRPDAQRIEFILALLEAGHGDRVMLSGDLGRKSYQTAYGGGPGLTYIVRRFVPWLRQRGVSDEQIHAMLVDNPARVHAWVD